jgi:predicted DCC family thiol-disulfide oxidoreductase YuxK
MSILAASTSRPVTSPSGAARLQVFFDGGCPLCSREMALLARRDRRGRIEFIDIAAPGFDAASWGRERSQFMAVMHVRLPDGSWALGVEGFRNIYSSLGFGWLVAPTRLPGIRQLLDAAYRVFARHRPRLQGDCAAGGACGTPRR